MPDTPSFDDARTTDEGRGRPSTAPMPPGVASDAPRAAGGERIGRFEVRAFLGEGAFGRVYRAFDPALRREVALKVARADRLTSDDDVERFFREARAAAMLQHPNIVAVFDSGEDGPHRYIASAFVEGCTLEAFARRRPVTPAVAVGIVRLLAEAVAHANAMGVVHRDIKPANVMVRPDGSPMLMDFGLASRADQSRMTRAGAVMGTPSYMAPEQWAGAAGAAADQYSLGCVLYELLAGRVPFSGRDMPHLMYLHREVTPAAIPGLAPDLSAIVAKCLEKDPAHRYASADALADDLRRFSQGDPVSARPVSAWGHLWRWARRNPLPATLAAAVVVTAVVGAAVSAGYARTASANAEEAAKRATEAEIQSGRADRLRVKAESAADEATKAGVRALAGEKSARVEAERAAVNAYAGRLLLAANAPTREEAAAYLQECAWHLRGWEHRLLWGRTQDGDGPRRVLPGEKVVWLSADGSRALLKRDKAYHLVTTADGVSAWSIPDKDLSTLVVRASPDGRSLAFVGDFRRAMVVDAVSGRIVLEPWLAPARTRDAGFSPDGFRVAVACSDKRVYVHDAATGRRLLTLVGHTDDVHGVAWSHDGRRIATGANDRTVRIWDAADGRIVRVLKGHTQGVLGVAWSPVGSSLVSVGRDNVGRVWNVDTGTMSAVLTGHREAVTAAVYSPDGTRVVTASEDRTVRVYDAGFGRELLNLGDHDDKVTRLSWSEDGVDLRAVTRRDRAIVHRAGSGPAYRSLLGHTGYVTSLDFRPDGTHLATGGYDNTTRVWDLRTGGEVRGTFNEGTLVTGVRWTADGRRVLVAGGDMLYHLSPFDADTSGSGPAFAGLILGLAANEAGPVVTSHYGGEVYFRGRETLEPVFYQALPEATLGLVALSPDGRRLATCGKRLRWWDARTGRRGGRLEGHAGSSTCAGWLPDGDTLISGDDDGRVRVYDVPSGTLLRQLTTHAKGVDRLAVSPDGRRVASGSDDGTLSVTDARTGRTLFRDVYKKGVSAVGWSRDGTALACADFGGDLRVYLLPTGTP